MVRSLGHVVVIGGGYTGLSTALSLRAQGVDVVLLEQGFAGSGKSLGVCTQGLISSNR